jgi:hypothetical protein
MAVLVWYTPLQSLKLTVKQPSASVNPESQASVRDGITSLLIGAIKQIFGFFFRF